MQMFGRTVIYTDVTSVTAENVRDVLTKALAVNHKNQAEIDYLYGYYKGKTPILQKKKEVRPTINRQICENRANEIVNFKMGTRSVNRSNISCVVKRLRLSRQ